MNGSGFIGICSDLSIDHSSAYFKHCIAFWYLFPKKMHHFVNFQSVDGSARWQTSFNFNHTPHAGTLPSGWVIVDPQCSYCSACPVLQRTKHLVCRQKATQIVLPPKIDQ